MTDREQTCCFTGHRSTKLPWGGNENDPRCLELRKKIAEAVLEAYDSGIRRFICGMAIGCDTYFAEAVIALREEKPDVRLEAAVPCERQDQGWGEARSNRYDRLLASCDCVTLLGKEYTRDCMQRRNEYMVDHSSVIIAVFNGKPGGTLNTLRYAVQKGLKICEIEP